MNFWHALPRPIFGLAPMDGVTDAAFRGIVAQQGPPDVMFTEFTHVTDVCRGADVTMTPLIYGERERPIVAQLYGKDPDLFYVAVQVVCELGFDGIDLNMGCPSRCVASSGSGAGLIRTPALARAIIRAAQQGIEDWAEGQRLGGLGLKPSRLSLLERMNQVRGGAPPARRRLPLSIKTRLGCDDVVIDEWIEFLLDESPAAITIHGRTLAQMYRGEADWRAIARAAEAARMTSTLILGNGDIRSLDDAVRRIDDSGVQGVLVGRGTLGEPWLFRDKEAARRALTERNSNESCRSLHHQVLLAERLQVLLAHAQVFEDLFGRTRFPHMRKHLGWYCKGFPHAAAMRARMVRMNGVDEVAAALADLNSQGRLPATSEYRQRADPDAKELASVCPS
ncbi:MAG: tRNA-dihydrouridine synthase [Nitrospiraceae bacterium]